MKPRGEKFAVKIRKLPIAWFGKIVENIQLDFKEIRRKQAGVYHNLLSFLKSLA